MWHNSTSHETDIGNVGEDRTLHNTVVRKARGSAYPQTQVGDVVGVDELRAVTGQPHVERIPLLDGGHRSPEHLFEGLG